MVKLITHNFLSVSLSTLILSGLGMTWFVIALAALPAMLTNTLIDRFGHGFGSFPRRSVWTHSILSAPFVGAVTGLGLGILLAAITLNPILVLAGVVAGVISSFAHLFGDSLCEGGIYVPNARNSTWTCVYCGRHLREYDKYCDSCSQQTDNRKSSGSLWKRWRLAHYNYNNPWLNLGLIALSVLIVLSALAIYLSK